MDWAFGEELNDSEVSLVDQMRMWEQDELRKMQEEGTRSPFTQWRTVNEALRDEGLDPPLDIVIMGPLTSFV
jgi:hypothetical protein